MTVHAPGFSERVFEFGFNAEFAQSHRAVLAAVPHIPTQNQEKLLGYDVKFEVKKNGGAIRMIALQHKVARQVCGGTGPKKFESAVGSDYFAFRLDVDQFNLIQSIMSSAPPGLDFYYCAPIFASMADMNTNYLANEVQRNSAWFDAKGVGNLSTHEPHSIVYSKNGSKAYVFSQTPQVLRVVSPSRFEEVLREERQIINPAEMYRVLHRVVSEHWVSRTMRKLLGDRPEEAVGLPIQPPPTREVSQPVDAVLAIAEIAGEYLGCSVFVQTQETRKLG